jgi:hypothetical protein
MRHLIIGIVFLSIMVITLLASDTEKVTPSAKKLFEKELVTFGFAIKGHIFCDPLSRKPDPTTQPSREDSLRRIANPVKDYFASLPLNSLPSSLKEHVGDTLTMVWSKGSDQLVVGAVGFYSHVCHGQLAYKLLPIDSTFQRPNWRDTFLLLRKGVRPAGPVVPYSKYEIRDASIRVFEDSVRSLVTQAIIEHTTLPLDTTRIEYYGVHANTLPDTLFMTVHGRARYSTEACWHTVYLMVRSNDTWNRSTVIDLHPGACRFRVDSSFDLDGDGGKEFLVMHRAGGAVYSIIEGRMVLVASSGYRGC